MTGPKAGGHVRHGAGEEAAADFRACRQISFWQSSSSTLVMIEPPVASSSSSTSFAEKQQFRICI